MNKSLTTTEPAKEGEILPPKREITFKPITKKMECNICGAEADATFHPTCSCNGGFRSKRQMAAEAITQHPEKSDRAIAKEIGVSQPTVSDARNRMESGDKRFSPPTHIGRDGKTYPASQPQPPITEAERREEQRRQEERHRADVEAVKRQIIKWFFILSNDDQDRVLDTIDKLRTEKLERGESASPRKWEIGAA